MCDRVVAACNLLAFQIEIALDDESTTAQKDLAKARIHATLAYFRDSSDIFPIAKWTLRVSEWVVKRAGLLMKNDSGEANGRQDELQEMNDHSIDKNGNDETSVNTLDPMLTNESLYSVDHVFPEHWIQAYLGESFFAQLDEDFLSFQQS